MKQCKCQLKHSKIKPLFMFSTDMKWKVVSPPHSRGLGPGHGLCCVLGQQTKLSQYLFPTQGEMDICNFCREVQKRVFDQVSR